MLRFYQPQGCDMAGIRPAGFIEMLLSTVGRTDASRYVVSVGRCDRLLVAGNRFIPVLPCIFQRQGQLFPLCYA